MKSKPRRMMESPSKKAIRKARYANPIEDIPRWNKLMGRLRRQNEDCVYLIEWQSKSGWSEIGQNKWEADHTCGIWFTLDGAIERLNKRLSNPVIAKAYKMRISKYKRVKP